VRNYPKSYHERVTHPLQLCDCLVEKSRRQGSEVRESSDLTSAEEPSAANDEMKV